jgi:hypothetical protein
VPLVESLRYVVTADTAGAQSNLARLGTAAQGSMSTLDKLKATFSAGIGIGAGAGAIDGLVSGLQKLATVAVDQLGQAVNAASSLQQAAGATSAIFGDAAKEVQAFGRTAADSVGLSNAAFQQQASVIGALVQNLGQTRTEAAATSTQLIKTGADLAATFGGKTADAVGAIASALRGERDPIERYGISIKQAAVDQEVFRLGLDTSTASLKASADSTATLSLIQKQAATSAGAFARESGTLAGQQQRFNAELEDARAELGEALLPAMTELVKVGRELIPVIATIANNLVFLAEKAGDALGPVVKLFDKLGDLPLPSLPNFQKEAEGSREFVASLEETASGLKSGQVALEQFAPALAFLPPSLRAAARELFGIKDAADAAATGLKTLETVSSALGSIGDTLFGAERAQTAFNKSLDDSGGAANNARSQAKAYESALRSIEDAERGVADAQEALNETLIARFLVGLGASSDEVTSAQIQERESTRSLADAKLRLIDAEQALARLRGGGAAASRLEAQAAFLDAQKALSEAQSSGDTAALLKAKAAVLRAQQGLDDTSSARQAQDVARAQSAVESAADGVTQAAIDQRKAQRDLNDTLIRGKEGSLELRDANRQVEDAQRRLEDQTRNLDDAQDGLVDALNRTSAAGKTAAERFDDGVKSADSWIQFLIKNKATPDQFAAAVDSISKGLSSVATEAGKTSALDEYNTKLAETLRLYTELGGFGSKQASDLFPKGGMTTATSTANSAEARAASRQPIQVNINGRTLFDIVLDENASAGSPIVTRTGR